MDIGKGRDAPASAINNCSGQAVRLVRRVLVSRNQSCKGRTLLLSDRRSGQAQD